MTGPATFIRANTELIAPPLVPEIALNLARGSRDIFRVADAFERPGERWPPYWAFAWPGGQALARYILDHRHLVVGRRIADIGAGSGLAAIAALRAGALSAIAIDPDPLACTAARLNAEGNGVALEVQLDDPLGRPPEVDMILIGDLVYEPELETRVTGFLEAAQRQGTMVLFGDRTTARRPRLDLVLMGEYRAPLTPALEDGHIEHARVWLLEPRAAARPQARRGRRT